MRAVSLLPVAAVVVSLAVSGAPLAAQQRLALVPPVAAPIAAPAAARWIGVYRLTFADADGSMFDARVLVEPAGDRVIGTLVVDQQASGITAITAEGGTLRARIVAQEGRGELALRETGEGVAGTLTIGRRVWQVTGVRAF